MQREITPHHVEKILELLKELQKIDPEFPLQYSICLAEIALNEGLSLTELSKKTNLSISTVSRIVGALSDFRKNNRPYGLVKLTTSETERRRKALHLTPKGRQLLITISTGLDANSKTQKSA